MFITHFIMLNMLEKYNTKHHSAAIMTMSVIISIIVIFGYNYTHYEVEESCYISTI